jgi:hypothetical protein
LESRFATCEDEVAELLGQCRAYLVARTGAETASLRQIAEKTGFGEIETLSAPRQKSTPGEGRVNFFIVHHHIKESMMAGVIRFIRLSDDDQIRFAPVILFAEDGPFEKYLRYVHLGYDDVITLPDKQPVLVQRLLGQLRAEQTYYETREYFGPDRRRMEAPWETDSRRLSDSHGHTRYAFTRDPGVGIRINRTEIFARSELANATGMLPPPLPRASALR